MYCLGLVQNGKHNTNVAEIDDVNVEVVSFLGAKSNINQRVMADG
jgi:hypothetical protein